MKIFFQFSFFITLMLICFNIKIIGQNQPFIQSGKMTSKSGETVMKPDSGTCGSISHGGQLYHTVVIGYQCWMKENLNIGKWVDQGQLQRQTDNGQIEKYCFGNDFVQCDLWGGLYQWDEMMQYIENPGAQGICPGGWHIPTAQDWKELIRFLGGNSEAGGTLKSSGTRDWQVPNVGATNASGFTAYPGGIFDYMSQQWQDQYVGGYYWSSEMITKETNVALFLTSRSGSVELDEEYRPSALSVRCIRNE